jgi:simple sugar transport system ATP-binding protein
MTAPLLEARSLVKTYGHVQALRGASFTAYPGEVVALVGDNGAGKSTLVTCLSGTARPDSGEIWFEGRRVDVGSPAAARRLGIETVYQDLALAPDLDSAANLFLGREVLAPGLLGRLGVLDRRRMRREATVAFGALGIDLPDVTTQVASLSGGQRQSVAVARAVAWSSGQVLTEDRAVGADPAGPADPAGTPDPVDTGGSAGAAAKVVFMDEPTAALGVVQRERVLDVIRRVRDRGVAVVLISHNMPEVLAVADRVEVLRLGRRVARFDAAAVSLEDLVAAMTGAAPHHGEGGAA